MQLDLLPHQHALCFSNKKYVDMDGGFGNGKSTGGMIKLGLHCENNPGTKVGFFRQDFSDIRRGSLEDWNELFGDHGSYNHDTHFFTFDNSKSKVLFHQLSDRGKLKNHNLSAALIEQAEETDQASFSYLIGRIRRQDVDNSEMLIRSPGGNKYKASMADRWIACLSNPEGHDWIWKLFIEKDLSDLAMAKSTQDLGDAEITEDDFHYIWADTYANMDNLTKDYLAGLKALPQHLYKRYVEGNRDSFEGQIYSMLDKAKHYVEPFRIPEEWPKYRCLDHGVANPTAVNWFAIDPNDNVFCYREHYKEEGDDGKEWVISQHANAVKNAEENTNDPVCPYKENINSGYADPAVFDRTLQDDSGHYTVADAYQEEGLNFNSWKNAQNAIQKTAMINRVQEYFMVNPERENPITGNYGSPQAFIFRCCPNTWEEHVQYQWKEASKRMVEELNNPEKPRKYMDHTCDNFQGFISMKRTAPTVKKQAPQGSFKKLQNELKRRSQKSSGSRPNIR